jgi:hypothetical protein
VQRCVLRTIFLTLPVKLKRNTSCQVLNLILAFALSGSTIFTRCDLVWTRADWKRPRWKRPRKSPSHFSVEDGIFIHASDHSGRETTRMILWLTIVEPEDFSHFAPTCAFSVKQP